MAGLGEGLSPLEARANGQLSAGDLTACLRLVLACLEPTEVSLVQQVAV